MCRNVKNRSIFKKKPLEILKVKNISINIKYSTSGICATPDMVKDKASELKNNLEELTQKTVQRGNNENSRDLEIKSRESKKHVNKSSKIHKRMNGVMKMKHFLKEHRYFAKIKEMCSLCMLNIKQDNFLK